MTYPIVKLLSEPKYWMREDGREKIIDDAPKEAAAIIKELAAALERSAEGFASITKEAYPIAPSPEDWERMVFVARTSERRAREALRKLKDETTRVVQDKTP